MKHRGYLALEERQARSQLTRIVHQEPFLRGSLVESTFKCGKSNCWCNKNKAKSGHPACYLSMRLGKKRKMIYIPKTYEKQIRQWVATYKNINKMVGNISKCCLARFKQE